MDQSIIDTAGIGQNPDAIIKSNAARREPLMKEAADVRAKRAEGFTESERLIKAQEVEAAPAREAYAKKAGEAPDPRVTEEKTPDFKRPTFDPKELNATFGILLAASMLLGKSSRGPYDNVMNSMTGAINGFLKGDQQNVEEAMKTFDKNLAAIKERNNAIRHEVESAEKKFKNDLGGLKAAYELIVAKYDLPLAQQALRDKSLAASQTELWKEINALDQSDMKATQLGENTKMHLSIEQGRREDRRDAMADRRAARGDAAADRSERMAETRRHNMATETNTANRNATYKERVAGAGKQGLKGKSADAYVHNEANIEALGDVLSQMDESPGAFGFKTLMPGIVLNRMDPEGTPVRAGLANITSMTIKDRAGTAQTVSEMKNLAPFIPRDGDDEGTVKTKINGMISQMQNMNKHLAGGTGAGSPSTAAPAAPFSDADKERRYQEWKAKQSGG